MKSRFKKENGQVMMLSIIMIGGVLLTAAAIAGVLLVFNIRSSTDAVSSAQALFAADAALERQTYDDLACNLPNCNLPPIVGEYWILGNGTRATSSGVITAVIDIRSQGFAGNVTRALETIFSGGGPAPDLAFFCLGPGGASSACDINLSEEITLYWQSVGAVSCAASSIPEGWSGNKTVDGSELVQPTVSTTYTLTCLSDGGESISESVTVNVAP